jgi:hypothetical protein
MRRVEERASSDLPAGASRLRSCFCRPWQSPSIKFCRRLMLSTRAGVNWSLMMFPACSASSLQE